MDAFMNSTAIFHFRTNATVPRNTSRPTIASLTPGLSIWAAMTFLLVYAAAFGNLLTLLAIIRARWWKTGIQILIASLTIGDLLISLAVYPELIINILVGRRYPYSNPIFCRIVGYVVLAASYITPLHCCMIAINRLFAIVLPQHSRKVTNRVVGSLMALLSWAIPGIVFSVPLAGLDGYFGPSRPFGHCAWAGYMSSRAFSYSASAVTLYGPTFILTICYITIFIRLRFSDRLVSRSTRLRRRLEVHVLTVPEQYTVERAAQEARRLLRRWQVAKMMLMTFIVFAVCYIPLTTFFYLVGDMTREPMPMVLACLFTVSYLGPFCNPIIYAVMNRDFHNAYVAIFRRFPCATSRRHPGNRVSVLTTAGFQENTT